MITQQEFEILVNMSESSILDFKTKIYDFDNDKEKAITDFVKDVISFINTIRNQSAYIIIGIEEKDDGDKVFHGIDKNIDDVIFQDKVKDKIFPRPVFSFNKIQYKNKDYGIFEFPVQKYQSPLSTTIKLKGLEIGKYYFRRGTRNSEAIGQEVIRISDWLRSIPEANDIETLTKNVTRLLITLTESKTKISVVIAELLDLAKRYNLPKLIQFCTLELKGYHGLDMEEELDDPKYRIQRVFMSLHKIQINPYSYVAITESSIKNEMSKNKDFMESNLMFSYSISEIETSIESLDQNPQSSYAIMEIDSSQLLPESKSGNNYPVYFYIFESNLRNLYQSIRQKTIDLLMTI
jgi:hypothetical protein